jgi:mono/diheme cytochrome c family protein
MVISLRLIYKVCLKVAAKLLSILALITAVSCGPKQGNQPETTSIKYNQYYVQGEQLYVNHCSNCHQKSGTGRGLVYPPLKGSDYLQENFESVLCLMRYGISGELVVNGNNFNQAMPGISTLTDLEVAEIATYIFNTWGNRSGIVEVQDATSILNDCSRTQ